MEEFSSDEEPETLVISTRKSEAAASAKAGRKRGGKANAWLDSESAADKSSNKGKSKADRWLDDGSGDEIPTISASSSSAPAQGELLRKIIIAPTAVSRFRHGLVSQRRTTT